MPSVRPVIAADLPALARLHVAIWQESYAGMLPGEALARLSAPAQERAWADRIAAGDGLLFVAQDGPELLGYGACGPQGSAGLRRLGFAGCIDTLYLARAAHGRGLGRALMAEMAAALAAWGFRSAALWVLAGNAHARGFYAHLGGRPVARRAGRWGGRPIDEVAYGWRSLGTLAGG
jgi:GNAT superfamily N-acetyltransferase